jgi:hypothetical protein
MSSETKPKSLGAAIDEIIIALTGMEEKDQLVAINAVCTHLGLKLSSSETTPAAVHGHPPANPGFEAPHAGHSHRPVDIRTFKEEKQPSSAREMACIVAFYLENMAPVNERKDSIGVADIDKYFKQANFKVPTAPAQLLMDAKLAGYFDSAERGAYKLNPVGYNLVAHSLPKREGSTASRPRQTASKKGPKKSAAKKKNSGR